MNDEQRIEMLLTRAAHVNPTISRPADDVLRRAADQARFSWPRRHLRGLTAGLVACVLVAGGAVALFRGDGGPGPTPAPRPIRLTVDLPRGWHYDDSGLALSCASNLTPHTVYRGATIGDLRCPAGEGPTMSGPVLVAGQVDPLLAERVRTTGSPTMVGNRAAWVEQGGDAPYAFATYLVAGTENVGFAVVAPHGTGPEEPVVPSLQGEDVWRVPVEALTAASGVGVRGGERFRRHQLPHDVRAVVLTIEPRNVGAAPGGLVWSRERARDVLHDLRPARRSLPPCGKPISARTLWLQRLQGSWVRVDVTADAAGCQAAVSELGGVGRVAGTPAATARLLDEGEPRWHLTDPPVVLPVGDVTFTVPDGWQVVRDTDFDPCTATRPTVVLADSLAPSCLVDVGQRAYQPYLWMTTQPLEDSRSRTDSGATRPVKPRPVPGLDGTTLSWSKEMLNVDGTIFQGWLGMPADGGSGRLLLMGVPWQSGATRLQKLAGTSSHR
jgi:hypothetical protein